RVGRGLVNQILAGLHALHVAEGRVLVEIELERLADRHLAEVEVLEDLELGGEREAALLVRIEQRLFPEPIAREEELVVVPDLERAPVARDDGDLTLLVGTAMAKQVRRLRADELGGSPVNAAHSRLRSVLAS